MDGGMSPAGAYVHVRNLVLSCCGANNRMERTAKEKDEYKTTLIIESDDFRTPEAQEKGDEEELEKHAITGKFKRGRELLKRMGRGEGTTL